MQMQSNATAVNTVNATPTSADDGTNSSVKEHLFDIIDEKRSRFNKKRSEATVSCR